MLRKLFLLLAALPFALWLAASVTASGEVNFHEERSSPGDLEIAGDIAGLPVGSVRYIRYEELLKLPQEAYTVTDDENFHGPTKVSGISLSTLTKMLAPADDLVVAICYDKYRTNYPPEYTKAHHPLLVLRINGQEREHWPMSDQGGPLGPYLISHPYFQPSFKVLSHDDEPQIPFGVTRIEFRREAKVFGAITPPGKWPPESQVMQGYVIARQDCFRCHNSGSEGGTKAGQSWSKLAALANADGARFGRFIRNPASVKPNATMPPNSDYDDATLNALTVYFKTFAASGQRGEK